MGERGRGGVTVLIELRRVAETGSTNDAVAALARDGAAEGLWLRADRQTAGRGRIGRTWISPAGNLHASTLVRLRPDDPPAPTLALMTAVALHDALSAFAAGMALRVKWPNDILADGAKLAGILLERHGDAVIVGCGANLAHHPILPDRPTTDLAAVSGQVPDPDAVLTALANAFAARLAAWRADGPAPVIRAWLDVGHPIGTSLAVRLPDDTTLDGRFDGLDPDGALRLRLADGTSRAIHAGDVFLVRG